MVSALDTIFQDEDGPPVHLHERVPIKDIPDALLGVDAKELKSKVKEHEKKDSEFTAEDFGDITKFVKQTNTYYLLWVAARKRDADFPENKEEYIKALEGFRNRECAKTTNRSETTKKVDEEVYKFILQKFKDAGDNTSRSNGVGPRVRNTRKVSTATDPAQIIGSKRTREAMSKDDFIAKLEEITMNSRVKLEGLDNDNFYETAKTVLSDHEKLIAELRDKLGLPEPEGPAARRVRLLDPRRLPRGSSSSGFTRGSSSSTSGDIVVEVRVKQKDIPVITAIRPPPDWLPVQINFWEGICQGIRSKSQDPDLEEEEV